MILVLLTSRFAQADGGVAHALNGNISYGIDFGPYSTDELRTVYASLTCKGDDLASDARAASWWFETENLNM